MDSVVRGSDVKKIGTLLNCRVPVHKIYLKRITYYEVIIMDAFVVIDKNIDANITKEEKENIENELYKIFIKYF